MCVDILNADDKSTQVGEQVTVEWTHKDKHYSVTSEKFTTAKDANDECQKKSGHLVHFTTPDELTEAFNKLKIDTIPTEG